MANNGAQKFRPDWGRSMTMDWYDRAACKENSEAEYAFFCAPAKVRNQAIKTFCHEACPVVEQCAQFGDESMSEGVWGGEYRTMTDAQQSNNRKSSIRDHERDHVRGVVVKMYESGMSMRQISKNLRRGDQTVRNLLVEAGVPLRNPVAHGS